MTQTPENTPVIAAIGEYCDRPKDIGHALEPVALMARALAAANQDAGGRLLEHIDSIDLVGLISWRYQNPVAEVCRLAGIDPSRQRNTSMGGETPTCLIHDAALAIGRGEFKAVAIVGGESMNAVNKARKLNAPLNWTPLASKEDAVRYANDRIEISPVSKLIGVRDPSQMYPLYEMAQQAKRGETPAEGSKASALLWSRYAQVAADNPYAWLRHAPSAEDIGTVSADNRFISWPYPKLMVANPSVNQGAAIVVTSLALARQAGVAEENLIYLHGGGLASEPDDYLLRDRYDRSTAQKAALDRALELVDGDAKKFRHVELYSCFPVVPKMAMQHLGMTDRDPVPTVAGGLTFFGGPLNNYMSHATCAMVRALRRAPGELGLLYGQGGFVSKHHTLVLSTLPAPRPLDENYSVQNQADAARQTVPTLNPAYVGDAEIETYTIQFGRDGQPEQGVVIVLSPDRQQRSLARVGPEDQPSLNRLLDQAQSAVGCRGVVSLDELSRPNWRAK